MGWSLSGSGMPRGTSASRECSVFSVRCSGKKTDRCALLLSFFREGRTPNAEYPILGLQMTSSKDVEAELQQMRI